MPDRSQPRPLGERVLIKVLDEQEGTLHESPQYGMMLIPFIHQQQEPEVQALKRRPKPARGIVVAVGPGGLVFTAEGGEKPKRQYVPLDVNPGDEVLFYSEPGVPVEVDEEELVLVQESLVLIVLSAAPVVAASEHEDV